MANFHLPRFSVVIPRKLPHDPQPMPQSSAVLPYLHISACWTMEILVSKHTVLVLVMQFRMQDSLFLVAQL